MVDLVYVRATLTSSIMKPIEGLLVVVVLILTVLVVRAKQQNKAPEPASANNANAANTAAANNAAAANGAAANNGAANNAAAANYVAANNANANAEGVRGRNYDAAIGDHMRQNSEYFAVCGGDSSGELVASACGPNPSTSFAKFDYGAPNMDYKEYVASQAVDNKTIENHLEFVRDRKGLGPEGEFITGRTYSPDSHDSYDPVPWVGIRGRPQAVPQCNPTQVPDLDTNLFKGNRPYCFWT